MAKLTEAQKNKARGIREVRRSERRIAAKAASPAPKKTPTQGQKKAPQANTTKGITNIIKRRASQADRAFAKARG